jgi:hypothetical protein
MSPKVKCQYCNKELSCFGYDKHEKACAHNPKLKPLIEKIQSLHDDFNTIKEIANKLSLYKSKISYLFKEGVIEKKWDMKNKPQEIRDRISKYMKKAVVDNPDSYSKKNVCGRVKQYEYNGVILKGTWELKMAMWLDAKGIKWEYETNSYPYPWNNGCSIYFPDFYLPQLNVLIEVKGNVTDRDLIKWDHLPIKLVVVDKKYINSLDELVSILNIEDNGNNIDIGKFDEMCKPYKKIKYKECNWCGCKIYSRSKTGKCQSCSIIHRRKVERPSLEQLEKDIKEMPMTKVGKKYGVSDNCIRKWLKYYKNNA